MIAQPDAMPRRERGGLATRGAQHPLAGTGVRAAGHVRIERPVVLHRAAAHALEMRDVDCLGLGRGAKESGEARALFGIGCLQIEYLG